MAKALYREYRPKRFDEILGQDRVVNVLRNQVITGKISHAYIFSGERGTGKTSTAKIFAKAINCKNPKNGSPCLECENCLAIENETTIDVVEMDAASNRRIDDIRNLKDNVIYPPNNLKYKVYIIDEAHMITREAFNALLKIMEEPPKHLVFILATTEIEKVPSTILSRVQKFEFNKIDESKIKEQINIILNERSISIDDSAIDLIVKKANGAMRDALSILDQVISTGSFAYSIKDVESLLGLVDIYQIDKLSYQIVMKDSKASLEALFELRKGNKSNRDILDGLINYFNDILIYSLSGDDSYFFDKEYLEKIKIISNAISFTELSDYLDILIDYSNKLKLTDNDDVLVEVMILRLLNLKNAQNLESRIFHLEKSQDDNLVELVNKIVDNKLKNMDLKAIGTSKATDIEVAREEIKLEENTEQEKKAKEPIIENSNEEEIKSDKEDKTDNVSKEDKLNSNLENKIKSMLIKKAGGALNGLFADEGFNYKNKEDDFIIYIKKDFYKGFIENKIDPIEESLSEILGKRKNLKLESFDKMNNNTSTEETKNKEAEIDNLSRLKEIFGQELIIE